MAFHIPYSGALCVLLALGSQGARDATQSGEFLGGDGGPDVSELPDAFIKPGIAWTAILYPEGKGPATAEVRDIDPTNQDEEPVVPETMVNNEASAGVEDTQSEPDVYVQSDPGVEAEDAEAEPDVSVLSSSSVPEPEVRAEGLPELVDDCSLVWDEEECPKHTTVYTGSTETLRGKTLKCVWRLSSRTNEMRCSVLKPEEAEDTEVEPDVSVLSSSSVPEPEVRAEDLDGSNEPPPVPKEEDKGQDTELQAAEEKDEHSCDECWEVGMNLARYEGKAADCFGVRGCVCVYQKNPKNLDSFKLPEWLQEEKGHPPRNKHQVKEYGKDFVPCGPAPQAPPMPGK